MHPPSDPLFRTLTTRSVDQGATWEAPTFAPDFDWSGTECPGVAQTSRGTVLLTQFRFGWYPLAAARLRLEEGEPISLALPEQRGFQGGFTEQFQDGDWERSLYPWARGYHGLYAHRSADGGRTYQESVRIDTGSYRDGYTRVGPRVLAGGRLAYAVTEHLPLRSRYTYLLLSSDDGATWDAPREVVYDTEPRFGEPDCARADPWRACLHAPRLPAHGLSAHVPLHRRRRDVERAGDHPDRRLSRPVGAARRWPRALHVRAPRATIRHPRLSSPRMAVAPGSWTTKSSCATTFPIATSATQPPSNTAREAVHDLLRSGQRGCHLRHGQLLGTDRLNKGADARHLPICCRFRIRYPAPLDRVGTRFKRPRTAPRRCGLAAASLGSSRWSCPASFAPEARCGRRRARGRRRSLRQGVGYEAPG